MNELRMLAKELGFKTIYANWDEYSKSVWLESLLRNEEAERARIGLERNRRNAKIGELKLMADFDWSWPEEINRELVEELLLLSFLKEKGTNVALIGPNGVGKSMIMQNIAYNALVEGYKARFVPASQMLSELSRQESEAALSRNLKKWCAYDVLAIDELGYLDYSNRYADLLFQVISGRYQKRATLLTSNKPFQEWNTIFPNAMCVTTLVDRLMHKSELVVIKGKSFREKEAIERAQSKAKERKEKRGRQNKEHATDEFEKTGKESKGSSSTPKDKLQRRGA
jgi:DNA replication protein DnaC